MNKKIGIIGPGRLGMSLYRALKIKYDVRILKRDETSKMPELIKRSDVIFISTGDDEIENVGHSIADCTKDLYGKLFIHFSGQKNSDIFDPLRRKGAKAASVHPLTTFATKESEKNFYGIYFTIEGDKCECLLEDIFSLFEPRIIRITKEQKTKYHTAAVISSNLLCVLLDISDSILKDIGFIEGIEIQKALISSTLQNIFDKGTNRALTGPAIRGDLNTISQHLKELDDSDQKIYALLTQKALRIARDEYPQKEEKYLIIEKELFKYDCK